MPIIQEFVQNGFAIFESFMKFNKNNEKKIYNYFEKQKDSVIKRNKDWEFISAVDLDVDREFKNDLYRAADMYKRHLKKKYNYQERLGIKVKKFNQDLLIFVYDSDKHIIGVGFPVYNKKYKLDKKIGVMKFLEFDEKIPKINLRDTAVV